MWALIIAVVVGGKFAISAMNKDNAELSCLAKGGDYMACTKQQNLSEVKDSMGIMPLIEEKCATDGLDEASCNERKKKAMPDIAEMDALLDKSRTSTQDDIKTLCSGRGGDVPACIDRQIAALREMGRIMIAAMRSKSEDDLERVAQCEGVDDKKTKLRDHVATLTCMEKAFPAKKPTK